MDLPWAVKSTSREFGTESTTLYNGLGTSTGPSPEFIVLCLLSGGSSSKLDRSGLHGSSALRTTLLERARHFAQNHGHIFFGRVREMHDNMLFAERSMPEAQAIVHSGSLSLQQILLEY